MSEEIEIIRQEYYVPVSEGLIADNEGLREAIERTLRTPTPVEREQYAAWREQRKQERAAVRRGSTLVEVAYVERLLGRLGWGERYALHFVQDYCRCEQGSEGWERCEHAIDLGIEVWM